MSKRMSDERAEALSERLRIVARGESALPADSAEYIIADWRRAREAEARLSAALEKIADHAGDDFNPALNRRYVDEWTQAEGFRAIQKIARKALGQTDLE